VPGPGEPASSGSQLESARNEGAHPECYDDVTEAAATGLGKFVRHLIRHECEMPAQLLRDQGLPQDCARPAPWRRRPCTSKGNHPTVGMPYCAAKTRGRPGATAFGAGAINAIVLIAMVAGVGASGLLLGWITLPALVFGLIFWNVGADAVATGCGTRPCVSIAQCDTNRAGSVRPNPLGEEWLEKALLVIRGAEGIVAAAV
jgi:hypothetical protein